MLRGILGVFVLINVGLGVGCLVDPVRLLAPVGVSVVSDAGLIELRAMYGGLELGFGLFLGWCMMDLARVRIGLVAAMWVVGGLGLARVGAYVVSWPDGWMIPSLCVVEVGGALVCGLALWWTRSERLGA